MNADLDTLLTALYVEIDDHIIAGRRGPGRPRRLAEAELACLAVAQVLLGFASERRWLRFARTRLGHLFPYLPHQPGYHKRLKAAAPLLAVVIDHLARQAPCWHDQVRLIDATPLPCGTSRETAKRSDLAGWAGYGYCASHSRFYWGLKLYVIAAPDGMPVAWCLASPKIGEREIAAELLAHAVVQIFRDAPLLAFADLEDFGLQAFALADVLHDGRDTGDAARLVLDGRKRQ